MLTRLDTLLLYGPCLVAQVVGQRGQWKRTAVGMAPLFVWEVFSFIYYGSLVPNTLLAKIPEGVSMELLLRQGVAYVADLFEKDLIAGMVIALAVCSCFVTVCEKQAAGYLKRYQNPLALLSFGIGLYCSYVVFVGGDYLSYRFWSLPLLCSGIVGLYRLEGLAERSSISISARSVVVVLLSLLGIQLWLDAVGDSQVTLIEDDRVKDFFVPLQVSKYIDHGLSLEHPWKTVGLQLRKKADRADRAPGDGLSVQPNVGIIGYYAGPKLHIVEPFALSEPLLARLPTEGEWRIGHFPRRTPQGYLTWLLSGDAAGLPPALREYLQKLSIVVRAPIFSAERLQALGLFSIGAYDHLLNTYISQRGGERLTQVDLDKLSDPIPAGTSIEDWRVIRLISGDSLDVVVDSLVHQRYVEVSVDCDDIYELTFDSADRVSDSIQTGNGECSGLMVVKLPIPERVAGKRIRRITIKPIGGDGQYGIGHLFFVN